MESSLAPAENPGTGIASRRSRAAVRAVAISAAVLALIIFGHRAGNYAPQFAAWVHDAGPWGPAFFVLGYAIATVAFVPGSVLTLVAGALFGLVLGTVYAFVAAVLGAAGAFLLARHLGRKTIEQWLGNSPRFAAMDRAVRRGGFRIVFLLRLSPVYPFNLLNYALGLTGMRFADYLGASVGMIPGTVLYVYYGRLAGDLVALAGSGAPQKGLEYYVVSVLGLVATIVVTTMVTRMARQAFRETNGA